MPPDRAHGCERRPRCTPRRTAFGGELPIEELIRVLTENSLGHVNKALDAHHELIRVLSERLVELRRKKTEKKSVQNRREQS